MTASTTHTTPVSRVAWRSLALPAEHGGWGMLAEPLLLGLLVAPSRAGFWMLLASLAAFLARHPLKLALSDHRRGSRQARTAVAESLALGYSTAALAGAAAAVTLAGPRLFAPLLAAAPLALVQVAFDARLRGRHLVAELSGAVALAALAPAVLLAGGWPTAPSLAAGALLATKAVTSVLYVRTRLRLDRNQHPPLAPALAAHAAAVVAAAGMAVAGWAPWIGTVAAGALLLRAAQGLSPDRRAARPQQVGIQELALGIGFALALALGFRALR